MGVVEITATGRARLIPITILDGGKYYDAGLYRATPRPMALEPETLYEATRVGESVGLFTVTGAQEINGAWVGLGQWRANNAPQPAKKVQAASAADNSDAPPRLQRPGSSSPPTAVPAPEKKTEAAKPPAGAAERPAPHPASAPEPDDSGRPVLRRGKPAQAQPEDNLPFTPPALTPAATTAKEASGTTAAKPAASPALAPVEILPAISDAHGPEPHSFSMELRAEEQQKYRAAVATLAYDAIRKFAAARPQHKPGPADQFADVSFRVFDVNTNNEPILVFSASLPELAATARSGAARSSGSTYFVTVVARVDMYGELHRLFADVSDSSHLDAFPRLQLMDAVDADGNGAGELLFRQYYDRSTSYVLYRVGMDRLWELFEGAESGT